MNERFSKRVEVEGEVIEVHVYLDPVSLKVWRWSGYSRKEMGADSAASFVEAKAAALKWLIAQIQKREEGWTKERLKASHEALS